MSVSCVAPEMVFGQLCTTSCGYIELRYSAEIRTTVELNCYSSTGKQQRKVHSFDSAELSERCWKVAVDSALAGPRSADSEFQLSKQRLDFSLQSSQLGDVLHSRRRTPIAGNHTTKLGSHSIAWGIGRPGQLRADSPQPPSCSQLTGQLR
jgi:hypothetical protein